jgi:hypothetical protein
LHHVEVEEQVDLVRVLAAEEVDQLFRDQVDLAQQHPVAAPAGDERTQLPQDLVGVQVDVADLARVDEERHRVDPETVDAELQPEAGDLGHLVAHLLVADVQVRLVRVERVQVVLLRLIVPGPDAVLGVGEHDRRLLRPRRAVAPDVEIAEAVVGRRARLAEPRVLGRRVVDD